MQSATISLQYIMHNIISLSDSSDSNSSGLPLAGVTNAQIVILLVSQILVFHRLKNENMELCIQKVDTVTRIHDVNNKII